MIEIYDPNLDFSEDNPLEAIQEGFDEFCEEDDEIDDDTIWKLHPAYIFFNIINDWGLRDIIEYNGKIYNAAFEDLMSKLVKFGYLGENKEN